MHSAQPHLDPSSTPGLSRSIHAAELLLESHLEAAGLRVSTYLRHLPLPETTRHKLTLKTLQLLRTNPGENPDQAAARAMAIVHELLAELSVHPLAMAAPKLCRGHMRPEEMDRRPWVRTWMRLWRPLWISSAHIFNSVYLDIVSYTLLLAGLYFFKQCFYF